MFSTPVVRRDGAKMSSIFPLIGFFDVTLNVAIYGLTPSGKSNVCPIANSNVTVIGIFAPSIE